MRRLNLVGKRFGKLVAKEVIPSPRRYLCVCDCGNTVVHDIGKLYYKTSCERCPENPRTEESNVLDAWAAGIVDGEGCIHIRKRKNGSAYMLFISVGQSGFSVPQILKKLLRHYGGNLDTKNGVTDKRNGNRKPKWLWYVCSASAERFLQRILPFLVGKKNQGLAAMEYRKTGMGRGNKKKAEEFFLLLKYMKRL